jgi:ADP-ribose pyrophosphatase YjhB (NUDIX family)
VLLFRDKGSGKYLDPGGGFGPGDDAVTCAVRELAEESLGLFRLDPAVVRQLRRRGIRMRSGRHDYTVFVVHVRGPAGAGIRRAAYEVNRAVTERHASQLPAMWKETDDMTRFYVADLLDAGLMSGPMGGGDLVVQDAYGVVATIARRARGALQHAHARGLLSPGPDAHQLSRRSRPDAGGPGSLGVGEVGHAVQRRTAGRTSVYW